MRLFIAINFNEYTKNQLIVLQDELQANAKRGSFTLSENIHLTLLFLGECNDRQLAAIKTAMDTLIFEPFDFSVENIGYFKRDGGNIWWAGVRECKPLLELQRSLSERLTTAGFSLEKRKYSPHITLGRRVITDLHPWNIAPFSEAVTRIELMKSERLQGKLTYTSIYAKGATDDINAQRD